MKRSNGDGKSFEWICDIPVGNSATGMVGFIYGGINGGGCRHLIRN